MEFFEVVERRRSIRRFKRVKIPEEDVRRIMEAGRAAPTDATLHLWSAVRVVDEGRKAEIARLIGQPHVEEGMKKENIRVRVYDKSIEISAAPVQAEAAGKPLRRERISNFPVLRKIEVPFRLRVDSARAVYRDGVLQIVVTKAGEYGVAELKID